MGPPDVAGPDLIERLEDLAWLMDLIKSGGRSIDEVFWRSATVTALCAMLLAAASGCGGRDEGGDGGSDEIRTEQQPFPAFRSGQKLKRCVDGDALRVGGFNLRIAGRMSCRAARSLVKGFAPHAGETVQRLHGFTCYSRPQPGVGILAVCINGDRLFRFNFG
jgi:hypothetical protein